MKQLYFSLPFFILTLFFWGCENNSKENKITNPPHSEVDKQNMKAEAAYLASRDKSKDFQTRLDSINSAFRLAKHLNIDSLQLKYLSYKSALYSNEDEHKMGIKVAETLLLFAKKIKDTAFQARTLAKIGRNYFDLHQYAPAYQSYFESMELYRKIGDSVSAAKSMAKMGLIKLEYGDYYGSESISTDALRLLNKRRDTATLSVLFMQLGISSNNRRDFEAAEMWYDKAFEINTEIPIKSNVLNSKGVLLTKKGNYAKAIETMETAYKMLENSPEKRVLNLLMLRDNLAYAKGKAGIPGAKEEIIEILKEKQAINDLLGQFAGHTHLAELYIAANNKIQAEMHAGEAFEIAQKLNATKAQLKALAYLIDLKENPVAEARLYKKLEDSMDLAHGKLKNTVDEISFRTAEKEKENLNLKQQNAEQVLLTEKEKTQKWAIGGGLAVSLAGLGIFLIAYRKNQRQKKEIEKQKNKVEELQRELHHRLKNNLSFIDFFITLAKGRFPDPAYREKLDELQNRINSMFEVHRQLFKKDDVTSVNAKTYISALVGNVKNAYASESIAIREQVADTDLRADISFPIGLIVNEFVTNSFKYAFPEKENGIISIELDEDTEYYKLKLSDNGKGLPTDFDINKLNSFGMETIKLLAQEYKGTFALNGNNGTKMEITFPKNAA